MAKKIRGFLLGHLLVFRLIVLTDLTGRIGSPLVDFATFRHQFQLHPPPALPAPRPELLPALLPALLRRPLRERWRRCAPRCAPRAPGVDRKVGFFCLEIQDQRMAGQIGPLGIFLKNGLIWHRWMPMKVQLKFSLVSTKQSFQTVEFKLSEWTI